MINCELDATEKSFLVAISPLKPNPRLRRKRGGGRPPKFEEPSRPVTVTLPESTLRELEQIDADRGNAIVKLTKTALRTDGSARPLVEIVEMAANMGLVVIGPTKALRQIPFLHLVEVAPARYLLALAGGYDFNSLEIAINDVLDDVQESEKRERELIVQLLKHMKRLRKADRMITAEILFVRRDDKTHYEAVEAWGHRPRTATAS